MRLMGESASHIRLVEQMSAWILRNHLNDDHGYMLIDHPSSSPTARPPKIAGFVPDIYVPRARSHGIIIAEAKTARDLETRHTLNQIEAFLGRCTQAEEAILILAVPWDMVRLGEAIIRQIRKGLKDENRVTTKVLEKLSG